MRIHVFQEGLEFVVDVLTNKTLQLFGVELERQDLLLNVGIQFFIVDVFQVVYDLF